MSEKLRPRSTKREGITNRIEELAQDELSGSWEKRQQESNDAYTRRIHHDLAITSARSEVNRPIVHLWVRNLIQEGFERAWNERNVISDLDTDIDLTTDSSPDPSEMKK